MSNKNKKDKKAQIGETLTWFIATMIIVFVLVIAILISGSYSGNLKNIKQQTFYQTADVLASKSMFSYMLTKDTAGNTVYTQIKDTGELGSFNGNLALQIFRGLYQKDYLNDAENIWLGIVVNTEKTANGQDCANQPQFCILDSLTNTFFGKRPIGELNTDLGYHTVPFTSEKITLDEKKYVELSLTGK